MNPARKPLPRLLLSEILLICLGGVVLLGWGGIAVTDSSWFCGKVCHTMVPFQDLWQGSTHRKVACVTCHDGGGGTFWARHARGLTQVVGYVTRARHERMAPEFSDRVCLGQGCHDQRLLVSRVKLKWTRVPFDHQPHLQESRRGLILRCTSCHARESMGLSSSADRDPCFLCHRPDPVPGKGDTECLLCHPADSLSPGPDFLHRKLASGAVPSCRRCHPMLAWWKGESGPETCTPCHRAAFAPPEMRSPEEIHRTHVTSRQIRCRSCHPVTGHGKRRGEGL